MTYLAKEKQQILDQILLEHAPLAVAFSGGVDSTFLLAYAQKLLGNQVTAITLHSPAFAEDESRDSNDFCKSQGIPHLIIDMGTEAFSSISHNPPDRCYHCKKQLFSRMIELAKSQAIPTVVDGTNADDLSDYRPGIRALAELGIISPLKDAGLTKAEIRQWLQAHGYAVWSKPAYACLASRIPYGEEITTEKLQRIDALEQFIRSLGFTQCRVRHHKDLARIEVLPAERHLFFDTTRMDRIYAKAVEVGFLYVSMDLAGYTTGGLNQSLSTTTTTL